MENIYDIDLDKFDEYCKKINFVKSKNSYSSNLKNGAKILNDMGENIHSFYKNLKTIKII